MFFRRFFMGAFLALLIFGALGMLRHNEGRGRGDYEAGYADGLRAAAANSESGGEKDSRGETAVPSQSRNRGDHMDRGHGHFSGMGWGFFPLAFLIGGFFKFAIFALIIGGLFKFFGGGRHWRHHHKGHRPPWAKHHKEDEPSSGEAPGAEKSPEDVEPDIKIG